MEKYAISNVERQMTNWENIFATYIIDEALILQVYKELYYQYQYINKKTANKDQYFKRKISKVQE